MSDLKPCPFCGGEAETWDGAGPWHVVCTECGTIGSPCLSEAEAIAAWNSRAAKPCYAADANYERCKYGVNRGWCDDAPFLVWDDTGHLFITMGGLKTWDVTDDARKWSAAHGTLTAEQVRDAVMSADRWKKPMGNTGLTNTHLIIRDDGWQAIADELNAELGSGTCELVETDRYTNSRETIHVLECSECGETCEHVNGIYPRCPHCGKAVKR